jgi:hypothetical protein
VSDLGQLSPWERERLAAIEQQLRTTSPALDHALARGAFRGLSDPPRRLLSRSGWPVVVLVVLGAVLVVLGLSSANVLPLIAGTYLVALCPLGRWLPLLGGRDARPRPHGRPGARRGSR